MGDQVGPYPLPFGGQRPLTQNLLPATLTFFQKHDFRLTSLNTSKLSPLTMCKILKRFLGPKCVILGIENFGPPPTFRVRPLPAPPGGKFSGAFIDPYERS